MGAPAVRMEERTTRALRAEGENLPEPPAALGRRPDALRRPTAATYQAPGFDEITNAVVVVGSAPVRL
jgi:hypothetical protein